jgi:hypothetical protein
MAHKSCAMQVRAMAEATAARSALVAPPLTSPLAKASTANTVKEGAIRPQGAVKQSIVAGADEATPFKKRETSVTRSAGAGQVGR